MMSRILPLAGITLVLAVVSYFGLNLLFPHETLKTEEKRLQSEDVFAAALNEADATPPTSDVPVSGSEAPAAEADPVIGETTDPDPYADPTPPSEAVVAEPTSDAAVSEPESSEPAPTETLPTESAGTGSSDTGNVALSRDELARIVAEAAAKAAAETARSIAEQAARDAAGR